MPEDDSGLRRTVASFRRHGFVFPIEVFSAEEKLHFRAKYEEFVSKYGSGEGSGKRVRGNKIFRLHLVAPWAAQIVRHTRLLAVVKAVLDTSNVLIWSSDLTVKSPRSSECFGWHQDSAYADLGPEHKLVTAWVALSESREENGCVRLVSGSQRLGELRHAGEQRTEDRNLVLGQTVASEDMPDLGEEVMRPGDSREMEDQGCREVLCQMEAGEASLHGWRTIHSSRPNTSDQPRLGLAIRFMCGDAVRQQRPVVRDRVSLATGHFTGDWFELEPEPSTEYGKAEWAEHKRSMGVEWERRRRSKQLGMLPSHQEKQDSQTTVIR